jgi:hypothetical protein
MRSDAPVRRLTAICGLIVIALAGTGTAANAATIDDLTVRKVADDYLIELHAHLAARAAAAYGVFANLANLRALNTDVRRIEITGGRGNDPVQLYTEIRACVLFYCRSIHETQTMRFMREANGGEVYATVLPRGDLRFGRAHWLFREAGGQTDLEVTAELQPAFPVPPLIGPWVVKRWLRMETERTSINIEKLARLPAEVNARAP